MDMISIHWIHWIHKGWDGYPNQGTTWTWILDGWMAGLLAGWLAALHLLPRWFTGGVVRLVHNIQGS